MLELINHLREGEGNHTDDYIYTLISLKFYLRTIMKSLYNRERYFFHKIPRSETPREGLFDTGFQVQVLESKVIGNP